MFWTDERVELLKKLWARGLSASKIADTLGGITRVAVIGKVNSLGLRQPVQDSAPTVPLEHSAPTISTEPHARFGDDAALVPSDDAHEYDADPDPLSRLRFRRSVRAGDPLAIYLTIHTLERLVRELLPFYGVDCPIAVVYDRNGREDRVVRGTLATIESWTAQASMERSMLVLVG